jgi:hypothetical protein
VIAFQPRATAAWPPRLHIEMTGPSEPLLRMIVGRGSSFVAGRKK